ncbi:hypothetical protein PoB_007036500 [Plakobranchus ocellatus]|uniref:Uncharacterized protein n=1 Tax=Plakobranchus ocellatus TaxID=259542 RepID=A0AAV4DIM7_9GAST|nr:hypothetical protein PoB_007036500 [Plakobranchus ocellatus]
MYTPGHNIACRPIRFRLVQHTSLPEVPVASSYPGDHPSFIPLLHRSELFPWMKKVARTWPRHPRISDLETATSDLLSAHAVECTQYQNPADPSQLCRNPRASPVIEVHL